MFPVALRKLLLAFLALAFLVQNVLVYTDSGGRDIVLSELALEGRALYLKHNCQSCHQLYGFGGPLGPDLTNLARRMSGQLLNDRLDFILTKGNKQMPAFNLKTEEINALKQYFVELNESGLSQPSAYRPFTPNIKGYVDAAAAEYPIPEGARNGRAIVESKCASCHLPYNEVGSGPTLLGLSERLSTEEIRDVITKGRPDKGMPTMAVNGINEVDIDSITAFLDWLGNQDVKNSITKLWQEARDEQHKQEFPIPWWVYPDPDKETAK